VTCGTLTKVYSDRIEMRREQLGAVLFPRRRRLAHSSTLSSSMVVGRTEMRKDRCLFHCLKLSSSQPAM
jgi:hypothetical protein